MNITIHITVHVYGGEKLNDQVLKPHSKNYGECGKEIIAPMRKINNREFTMQDVSDVFSVRDLWDWIIYNLCAQTLKCEHTKNISLYNSTEKYLVFNGLRYSVEYVDKPLHYFLQRMKISENEAINIQFLVCSDEGDALIDDGIRYHMYSNESGRHHCPHVHVDIKHECSGTFSLLTGEKLDGNITSKKYLKIIRNTILSKQKEFLEFWNEHTNGLTVDLNQFLGLIKY